jgi:hypothetical protein
VILQLSRLQQLEQLDISGGISSFGSKPRLDVSPAQLAAVLQALTALESFTFSGFGGMAAGGGDGEPGGHGSSSSSSSGVGGGASSSSSSGGSGGIGGSSSSSVAGVLAVADVLVGLPKLSSFRVQLLVALDDAAKQSLQSRLPSCWQQHTYTFFEKGAFEYQFDEGQVTLEGFRDRVLGAVHIG